MKFCRSHTRSWRRMWAYSWPKRCHIHWHLWFWVQKRPCAFRSSCLRSQKVFWRSHRIWWNEAKMVQDFRYALWQNVDWRWILASLLFSPTEIQILFPVWRFWQNFDPSGHSSGVTWMSRGINSAFIFNENVVPFNSIPLAPTNPKSLDFSQFGPYSHLVKSFFNFFETSTKNMPSKFFFALKKNNFLTNMVKNIVLSQILACFVSIM